MPMPTDHTLLPREFWSPHLGPIDFSSIDAPTGAVCVRPLKGKEARMFGFIVAVFAFFGLLYFGALSAVINSG